MGNFDLERDLLTVLEEMLAGCRNMPFIAEDATRAVDQLAPIGAWLMHCTEDVYIVPGVGQSLG